MSSPCLYSKVLRNCLMKKQNCSYLGGRFVRHSKIWEPDYLILAETKTPEYDEINVQIKGFDFVILEKFQSFIRRIANQMKVNVIKSWPTPQQDLIIHHYKINSTEIEYKYELKLHERNIQIIDVKSHIMPLFIEAVLTSCPPGVNISFHEHEASIEEDRYIPNLNILELQDQLESIGSDKKKKKKKKF